MGLLTRYLDMTRLVRRAEAGDGLAAWQAFSELHRLCCELPGDHEYRQLLVRIEPLIARFSEAIAQAASEPQSNGTRAALTSLRKACGIAGQASARNVQGARETRECGERAAWSALNREVARAIAEGDEPHLPDERSAWVRIAAEAAGVDPRTAREFDLPPVFERAKPAPASKPRRAKRRQAPQKPKRWRSKL